MKAILLITTDRVSANRHEQLIHYLEKLEGVDSVAQASGPHHIYCFWQGEDPYQLGPLISSHIRPFEGVQLVEITVMLTDTPGWNT